MIFSLREQKFLKMEKLKKVGIILMSLCGPRRLISIYKKFLSGDPVFSFPTKDKICCLTIDDGPGDSIENNYKMLNLLKKHDVKSTFFIISSNIFKIPENDNFMHDLVKNGHQIANHMIIDEKANGYSESIFEKKLLECEEILSVYDKYFKEKQIKCFRPPSGRYNTMMSRILQKHNYKNILGDVYSDDPNINDKNFHLNYVRKNLQCGSIIIFHFPEKERRGQTLEILEIIIPEILEKGFHFLTLEEAFLKYNFN